MRVGDYYPVGKRWWVRLHEKGGKRHEMPCHHTLGEWLDAYIEAAGIGADGRGPLFRTAEGRTGHQVQRFAGVDGPRWFLRAVFQGPAAQDPAAAAELESVVRDVVVVRGTEAMAPRELLPLRLPDAAPAPPPEPEGRPPLEPFQRGPEITEIR